MSILDTIVLPFLACICCTTPEPVTTEHMERTTYIGKYFERRENDANAKIQAYFKENKTLINTACLMLQSQEQTTNCTPLRFALTKSNYPMAVWFLDNDATPTTIEEKFLLKRAIQYDKEFNNKHIKRIILNTDVVEDAYIEEFLDGKHTPYTPLEFAKLWKNEAAIQALTLASKTKIETIRVIK